MSSKSFTVNILILTAVIVYLFVTAPPPLPETSLTQGRTIPIERVMNVLEAENDTVRAIYTKEIVGAGIKAGLAFGENWREPKIEKGPLPALFLRETAIYLEKQPVRLSLFLGSDFPINASNHFTGVQTEKFQAIKANQQPQYFYDADTELHMAMFPDFASAQACVTCHNQHQDTPKSDWLLNDIMGATTWGYPAEMVTLDEFMSILASLREGFRNTYEAYLAKTAEFANPPAIGDRWPRDGYYLPSAEVFMKHVKTESSVFTLDETLVAMSGLNEKN